MHFPYFYWREAGFDSQFLIGAAQAVSGVGLFVFAWMQWWLTKRAETTRQKERQLDKQGQIEAAYGVVWAEYNRIDALSRQVESTDVLAAILSGALTAEDVVPRDWGQSTASLGQLGLVSAQFGAVGYTILHGAASVIRRVESSFERARLRKAAPFLQLGELGDDEIQKLREMEGLIRQQLTEAANLLLDALEHSPEADGPRERKYNVELHSEHAKAFVKELRAATGATDPTHDG